MKRASLALCALGGFLVVLAGCSTLALDFDLGLAGGDATGSVRVMDGSPSVVAVTLHESLKKRGLETTVNTTGETYVVESKTAAGLKFALVLDPEGQGQTKVTMVWMDQRGDQETAVQIFGEFDRKKTDVKK